MDGFTFRGIHCEQMGCRYIPDESRIRNRMESYSVSSAEVAGRDGAYYFGATADERTFELACFFENITEKKYAEIQEWVRRDQGGELVFDDRPYVSYEVWPSKSVSPEVYMVRGEKETLLSGKMTITLTAYDPFGRIMITSYDTTDLCGATVDTGVMKKERLPAVPKTTDREFLQYNCGTEKANAIIRLAGAVDPTTGLTIRNMSNGTKCRIIGLEHGVIPEGAWLEIDGNAGQVHTVMGDEKELAFEFHDLGYLVLEPCTPMKREVLVSYTEGTRNVSCSSGAFTGVQKGQYIFLNKEWRVIGRVLDNRTIELNAAMEQSGTELTDIVTMNTIVLEGDAELTMLEIDYIPRTR